MTHAVDAELIERELQRLAASGPFRRAVRHLRFLRHLILLAQTGDTAGQREMALGVAVFHRRADLFDPRSDTIVRVEARRLRQKLAAYYDAEGREAQLVFTLPVGSYALRLQPRAAPADPARAPAMERVSLGRAALAMGSVDGSQRAQQLADEALTLQPALGAALVLKAAALVFSVGLTALPAPGVMPAAREAADAALKDSTLTLAERTEAHGLLATIAFSHDRHWPEALAQVQRALALSPTAGLHARHGWMQMFCGRFDAARAAYAAARALDPVSLHYRAHEGLIELYARRYDAAAQVFEDVLSVSPHLLVAQSLAASLHLYAGRIDAGLAAYRDLAERLPALSIGRCGMAQALALAGDRAGAMQAFTALRADFDAGRAPPYQLAMVFARLGDVDGCLHWLACAVELHDFNLVSAGVDPAFDTLRPDPRFDDFLKLAGLTIAPAGGTPPPIIPA
jgi:tetratricopeptide (TPR) repeat protein